MTFKQIAPKDETQTETQLQPLKQQLQKNNTQQKLKFDQLIRKLYLI